MNWSALFVAVLGLLRDGYPFPDWDDEIEVGGWLHRNEPHLAKIISIVVGAMTTGAMPSSSEIAEQLKSEASRQDVAIDMDMIMKIVEFIMWLLSFLANRESGATPGSTEG